MGEVVRGAQREEVKKALNTGGRINVTPQGQLVVIDHFSAPKPKPDEMPLAIPQTTLAAA